VGKGYSKRLSLVVVVCVCVCVCVSRWVLNIPFHVLKESSATELYL